MNVVNDAFCSLCTETVVLFESVVNRQRISTGSRNQITSAVDDRPSAMLRAPTAS